MFDITQWNNDEWNGFAELLAYRTKTLSEVEEDYLNSIKMLEQKAEKK